MNHGDNGAADEMRDADQPPTESRLLATRAELEAVQALIAGLHRKLDELPVQPPAAADASKDLRAARPTRLMEGDSTLDRDAEERYQRLEQRFRATLKDRELATALSGRSLVAGAASQLMKLWRDELEVVEEEGEYRVATRDGRAVSQLVEDGLAAPEFAHFCQPRTKGGVRTGDSSRPAVVSQNSDGPRNLGEIVVQRWQEAAQARGGSISRPIGLRRAR